MSEQASLARTITGRVLSKKMDKTILVMVERKVRHPKYGKYVKKRSKIFAHDENNQCHEGDLVVIVECRPISKNKSWTLQNIVENVSSN